VSVSFQQPSRGQVYKANLNPPVDTDPGHEYTGDWKIVLILQIDKLNRALSTVVVVPLTTTLKHATLPTCVLIERVPGNVLTEPCVALCHQVRALDKRKLRQLCGQLATVDTERVAEVVAQIIGRS
jgi:mRNA interferase MazF